MACYYKQWNSKLNDNYEFRNSQPDGQTDRKIR